MVFQRRVFEALHGRVDPGLLGLLGSAALTTRQREPCVMRYDDGFWIHRYRGGTVVKDRPSGVTARAQDEAAREVFLFDYVPRPGDIVFDVGAGMGEEVRLLSRLVGGTGRVVGGTGRVVGIEAHPVTFRGLRKAIQLNRLANVTALQCAVTGRDETVGIEDRAAYQSNGLTPEGGIPVPGRALAGIMAGLDVDRIDLLKMNIEGGELDALRGAVGMLESVEHLVVSCHDFKADRLGSDRLRTFEPVSRLLAEAGYRVRTRRDHPVACVRDYVYASR